VAARSGLRALNPRAAQTCHDKTALRQSLRDAGLPSPRFWLVDSPEAADRVAATVSYPCVVKPTSDSGSNGVRLVHDAADLQAHCRRLAAVVVNDRGQAQPGWSLVEEFLDGPEFSVETITSAPGKTCVIGITTKHVSDPPHFAELGHDFPSRISPQRHRQLEEAVVDALNAAGYDFGPAHTEVRLTDIGPVVVEINPRLAGGMIPELVRLAWGIDLLDVVLQTAAGRALSIRRVRSDSASIRFITAPAEGSLRRPPSLHAAREIPLVRQVAFEKAAGARVRPATCAADRLGYVIASGSPTPSVTAAATQAVSVVTQDLDIRP
jgi:biotin carboxylase